MKTICVDDIVLYQVLSVDVTERHYGEFKIVVKLDDNDWYVLCKDDFKETRVCLFSEETARDILEKYGEPDQKLRYSFIHNPNLWEEDIGEFDGYYGDGLDGVEELHYMD